MLQRIQQLDLWLLHAINSFAGNWVIDSAIRFVSSFILIKGTFFLTFYWFYWFRDELPATNKSRVILVKGILSSLVAIVFARILANFFPFRLRPFADPTAGFSITVRQITPDFESWSAFPSDHAAVVFALSFALFRISRGVSIFLLAYSAIVVCFPRVYIGLHYPSDVIAGALIGVLAAWIVQKINGARPIERVTSFAERNRPLFYATSFVVTSELSQMFGNIRAAGRAVIKLLGN